jgi:hypothetical protein
MPKQTTVNIYEVSTSWRLHSCMFHDTNGSDCASNSNECKEALKVFIMYHFSAHALWFCIKTYFFLLPRRSAILGSGYTPRAVHVICTESRFGLVCIMSKLLSGTARHKQTYF